MNQLAKAVAKRRQSDAVSRDRKDIYISDQLRRALEGRKETLTTRVSMIADRYMGLLDRPAPMPRFTDIDAQLVCNVLREVGRPLNAREIASFASMVADWLARNPDFPQAPGSTVVMILRNAKYHDLLVLVETMERDL